MSINTTTSSLTTSTTAQVSTPQNTENVQKTNSDKSFKEEMEKVSSQKDDGIKKEDNSVNSVKQTKEEQNKKSNNLNTDDLMKSKEEDMQNLKFASLTMNDVNSQLSGDIALMMNNIETNGVNEVTFGKGLVSLDFANAVSLTENDAQFFINLTQNEKIDNQTVVAQAQVMLDSGVEISQVKQNVNISQTLLNAIAKARENNQPLRIDFDQNVAVILRIGRDGAIAANFIPGDKVVEQYLKDNINSLKAVFDEAELPYSDLSYQSRGSKHQKEQRRNK